MPSEPRVLTWPDETEDERLWRRFCLRHVDQLLTAIEEHNVTVGGAVAVPIRLWRWYAILAGVDADDPVVTVSGATLMEAALSLQERHLRVAEPWPSRRRRQRLSRVATLPPTG